MGNINVNVFESASELYIQVANWWTTLCNEAIQARGKFHVALAGGGTPRALYELLASQVYREQLDWQHINFYFGDERAVALDHEQSNFRMASDAMLNKLAIPATDVYPLITDLDNLENCAQHYEKILSRELPKGPQGIPRFDLILLGMGDDGHTASLFPGTTILQETTRWVAPVYVDKLQVWRVSFTYPLINSAAHIAILASGDSKAGKLKQILVDHAGDNPIEGVKPNGELRWYIDKTAAKYLG